MPILRKKYSGFFQLNFYLFSNSQTRSGLRKSGSGPGNPVGEEGGAWRRLCCQKTITCEERDFRMPPLAVPPSPHT